MKRLPAYLGTILLLVAASGASAWGHSDQMLSRSQGWRSGPVVSATFYVEQWQWPSGYGIRLYVPAPRTADIHVSVEGSSLLIKSAEEGQLSPRGTQGPMFMQFSSFSQWFTLPADADMRQMNLSSHAGVIDIFIPRKR